MFPSISPVFLYRENVHSNDGVHNGQSPVERKFGDLRSRKLAVRVPKSHHCLVIHPVECISAHTVEARLPNRVVDRTGVIQMNRDGVDGVPGYIGCVFGQKEGADLVFCAKLRVDIRLVANSFLDLGILHQLRCSPLGNLNTQMYLVLGVSVLPNQFFIVPFKDDQTGLWITLDVVDLGKFHQDKGVHASSPSFAAVHP